MPTPLRVLIVEDRPADAELMAHELTRSGFEPQWRRVETEEEYLAELQTAPDVILADHTLPEFNAPRVLELLKKSNLDTPVIVVTGSISEEVAVERIKQGAADYILKDRMARLGEAVKHALEEKRLRDEKRQADAELQARYRELQTLHKLSHDVLMTADLQTLLNGILDIAMSVDSFDLGTILLVDPSGERVEAVAARGYQNLRNVRRQPREEVQGRSQYRALSYEKTYVIENVAEADGLRTLNNEGIQSAVLAPVRAAEKTLGFIQVGSRSRRKFNPDKIRLLEAIGNQMGVAIQKARLNEETQRNLERIRALHEIDIAITSTLELRMVLEFLLDKIGLFLPQASATTIRLLNKESGRLEPVACRNLNAAVWKADKAGRGLANVVLETKVPLMLRNAQADPRTRDREFLARHGLVSYLGVPLIAKREVLGVLGFYTKYEHQFSDEEVEFLKTLAGQAAIAIDNAQLYEEARTREAQLKETNRMLSALHAVAAAASQSLDLDQVLQAAIAKISDIFYFDATQIHIYNEEMDELLLRAAFESDPARFTAARSFKRGQGIVGKVAESGKPLIFEDVQTDPLYQQLSRTEAFGQFSYHFFAVLPIKSKLKNLGTLACVGTASRKLSPGEVQLLESLTDQIAVAIENSDLYEKVLQKVQELEQRTAELERANKVKDEFLSVMSHELRTPLNVVVGYAGMMLDGMLGEINPKQTDACAKIIRRTNDLLGIVDSILCTTSLEADTAKTERHEVDLGNLLSDLKSLYVTPLEKDLELIWDYTSDLPTITTDATKLKHVLLNLINNAIKFTEKGSITISAKISENATGNGQQSVAFQVADTGIGIAKEKLPIIFDKFSQADSSDTRPHEGVGLGLYIAKQFTELIGGEISVDSEAEKGSTFTVIIPVEKR